MHFSYASWNGPGYFKKFAKSLEDGVKSGKSDEELIDDPELQCHDCRDQNLSCSFHLLRRESIPKNIVSMNMFANFNI